MSVHFHNVGELSMLRGTRWREKVISDSKLIPRITGLEAQVNK